MLNAMVTGKPMRGGKAGSGGKREGAKRGRKRVNVAREVEEEFKGLNEDIHIAVMGCEVNGPGEARAADIGVAGGRGIGLIFQGGEVVRKVPEAEIVRAMREEVDKFVAERKLAKAAAGAVLPKDAQTEASTRGKQIFDKWRAKKMVAGGGKDK